MSDKISNIAKAPRDKSGYHHGIGSPIDAAMLDLSNSALDPGLATILEMAQEELGCPLGFITLLQGNVPVMVCGPDATAHCGPFAEALAMEVISAAKLLEIEDLHQPPYDFKGEEGGPDPRYFIGIPLRNGNGEVFGAIGLASENSREALLTDKERHQVDRYAAVAGRLMEARLDEFRLQDYLEMATDWIWEQDTDLKFSYFSAGTNRFQNEVLTSLMGKTRWEPLTDDPNGDPTLLAHIANCRNRLPIEDFRYERPNQKGPKHVSISGRPIFGADGRFLGYRGIGRDVTIEEEARRQIEYLASHDPLTGLANRVAFAEKAEELIAEWQTSGEIAALFLLDLDNFKLVNDTHGHATGDELLKAVAHRLRGQVSEEATVARLGGDEFAILEPALRRPAAMEECAVNLIKALSEPEEINNRKLHSGCSIGIAILPQDGGSPDQLLGNADLALYNSKREGRGRYCFYKPTLRDGIDTAERLRQSMSVALDDQNLEIGFREVRSLADGRLIGAQAVHLWHQPDGSTLKLATLRDMLSQSSDALLVGNWMLQQACAAAAAWPGMSDCQNKVTVALNAAQVSEEGLVDLIDDCLRTSGLPAQCLQLDFLPECLLQRRSETYATLRGLRKRGVNLGLLDFGANIEAALMLTDLGIDRVKLDMKHIPVLANTPRQWHMIQAMARFAVELDLNVTVAEFTSAAERRALQAIGCDEYQPHPIEASVSAPIFHATLAREAHIPVSDPPDVLTA